jgi:hypothetical protein
MHLQIHSITAYIDQKIRYYFDNEKVKTEKYEVMQATCHSPFVKVQVGLGICSKRNRIAGPIKKVTLVQITNLTMASKVLHLPTGTSGLPESGTVITKYRQFQVRIVYALSFHSNSKPSFLIR